MSAETDQLPVVHMTLVSLRLAQLARRNSFRRDLGTVNESLLPPSGGFQIARLYALRSASSGSRNPPIPKS